MQQPHTAGTSKPSVANRDTSSRRDEVLGPTWHFTARRPSYQRTAGQPALLVARHLAVQSRLPQLLLPHQVSSSPDLHQLLQRYESVRLYSVSNHYGNNQATQRGPCQPAEMFCKGTMLLHQEDAHLLQQLVHR